MINERLIDTKVAEVTVSNVAEQGLILHLDANDVDSYDGDGSEWVDISTFDKIIPISDNADSLELYLNASDSTSYGGSGTTWTDVSGNSNDGTISGATFDTDNGGYLDFDGSNDNVSISGSLGIGVNDYTYEVWFNADTVSPANQNLITTSTDHVNYGLQVNTTGVGMYSLNASGGASYLTSSTGLLSANTWYHLAYVKSSTLGLLSLPPE